MSYFHIFKRLLYYYCIFTAFYKTQDTMLKIRIEDIFSQPKSQLLVSSIIYYYNFKYQKLNS